MLHALKRHGRLSLCARNLPPSTPESSYKGNNSTAGQRCIYNTSNGSSQCSVVMVIESKSVPVDLLQLTLQISQHIDFSQSSIMVKFHCLSYGGLCLTTMSVPTSSDLARLETFVCGIVLEGSMVWCEIPASRSFCKLVGVPFFRECKLITHKDAEDIILSSIFCKNIHLTASPQVICDSKRMDGCTIYFNIWDSQMGSQMKTFINCSLNVGQAFCFFRRAAMKIGLPLCTCCYYWCCNLNFCNSFHAFCPICTELYHEENHHQLAGYCKSNPKATLLVPPTTDGDPCPLLSARTAARNGTPPLPPAASFGSIVLIASRCRGNMHI